MAYCWIADFAKIVRQGQPSWTDLNRFHWNISNRSGRFLNAFAYVKEPPRFLFYSVSKTSVRKIGYFWARDRKIGKQVVVRNVTWRTDVVYTSNRQGPLLVSRKRAICNVLARGRCRREFQKKKIFFLKIEFPRAPVKCLFSKYNKPLLPNKRRCIYIRGSYFDFYSSYELNWIF